MKYLIVALAVALSGCGSSWQDVLDSICTQPPPTTSDKYVVKRGDSITTVVTVGGSVAFDIVPAADGSADTECVLAWAVEQGGFWNGGNGVNTYTVRLNAYDKTAVKVKVYDKTSYRGEEKIPSGFVAGEKYHVVLAFPLGKTDVSVNGITSSIASQLPQSIVVGVGWPPEKRLGCEGAVIDNMEVVMGAGYPPD